MRLNKTEVSAEHLKYRRNLKRRKIIIHVLQVVILVGFFGLWELAARLNWIDPFIVSSPSRSFEVIYGMFADGTIYEHIGVTMLETVIGFVAGTVLGVIIAVLLWWSEMAQKIFDPYLVVAVSYTHLKRLGIMGRTGSGKTMLCNLIMRYYDPVHGNVTLNDTDMRLLDLAEVRKCFSPVMQDVFPVSYTHLSFGAEPLWLPSRPTYAHPEYQSSVPLVCFALPPAARLLFRRI